MLREKLSKLIPIILATIFVVVGVSSISYKSHTRDENRHLVRGVMLLETGDYRLNKHHPVLANVIAAVPQLFNEDLEVPSTESDEWKSADKDALAEQLIEVNGGKRDFAFKVLNKSRYFMIIVFAVISLFLVWQVSDEFGTGVGNIFAFLYFLSPNLIANARLVTTDALVVPLVLIPTIFLYKYAKHFDYKYLLWFFFTGFLALITKYSVLPIAFVWMIALIVIFWTNSKRKTGRKIGNIILLVLSVVIGWAILLWATYGFRLTTLVATNYEDAVRTQNTLNDIAESLESIPGLIKPVQNLYSKVKFPFPEYIQGFLENVVFHNVYGHDTFLAGNYSKTGWWWYFPFAMLIKMPIPVILMFIVSIGISVRKLIKNKKIDKWWVLSVVPVFYFALSMKSSINLGIRHVLIVLPFIYLLIAQTIVKHFNHLKHALWLSILGIWCFGSILFIYPHYLEYFNEFIGGPQNGHYYLLDSNLSWAQDDFYVEDYIDKLEKVGDVYRNPLEQPDSGYIVIDTDLLMGRDVNKRDKTKWLRDMYLNGEINPIRRIAYTYLVFEL
jgi:hypothetical protein